MKHRIEPNVYNFIIALPAPWLPCKLLLSTSACSHHTSGCRCGLWQGSQVDGGITCQCRSDTSKYNLELWVSSASAGYIYNPIMPKNASITSLWPSLLNHEDFSSRISNLDIGSILSGAISPAVACIIYMARLCFAKLTASGRCTSTSQWCLLLSLLRSVQKGQGQWLARKIMPEAVCEEWAQTTALWHVVEVGGNEKSSPWLPCLSPSQSLGTSGIRQHCY